MIFLFLLCCFDPFKLSIMNLTMLQECNGQVVKYLH